MNLIDFDQYFYQSPVVESVTTGGNFELVNLNDDEKLRAEEFIKVCIFFYHFIHLILTSFLFLFQKNGVHGLDNYLSQRLNAWREHPLDIAVVGSR